VLLASTTALTSAATAGSWQITYQTSGTGTWGSGSSFSWTVPTEGVGSLGRVIGKGPVAVNTTATLTEKVQATATWVPASPTDTPPELSSGGNLYITENAWARSETIWDTSLTSQIPLLATASATVTADDGLGDTYTPQSSTDYTIGALYDSDFYIGGGYSSQITSVAISQSGGTYSVQLPKRTITTSAEPTATVTGLNPDTVMNVDYNITISDTPPQSIMINGSGNVFKNGQWTGNGASLFSNNQSDTSTLGGPSWGTAYGPLSFTASLLGTGWPSTSSFLAGDFERDWDWASNGTPTDGSTYVIDSYSTTRPWVAWPYDSNGDFVPRDFLEECQDAPSPQSQHVLVRLTDIDETGTTPANNFSNSANYYVTLHSQYELIAAGATQPVPTASNPWNEMFYQSADIETAGPFSNWSPSIYYSVDTNWNVTINAVYLGAGLGGSTGSGLYINPPPTTVPAGYEGVVYEHPYLINCPFTYNEYGVGGQIIYGYDASGNVIPFSSSVNRSASGLGTYDINTKIYTFLNGTAIPTTVNYD